MSARTPMAHARATPETTARVDDEQPREGLSSAVVAALVTHRDRFLTFLQRRVPSREAAEEILQEAFVRGIGARAPLRADESAVAWFYRLLRNALVDRARRDAARARALAAMAREMDGPAAAESEGELREAICQCLLGLLSTLRSTYATALRQVDLGAQSLEAFARAAGISRGNAAVRLHRARQALRQRVEESCGACATHGCYQCLCRDAHPADAAAASRAPCPAPRPDE